MLTGSTVMLSSSSSGQNKEATGALTNKLGETTTHSTPTAST